MLICGIKASHDAAVAVIEDNRLLFSIEIEKINNAHRYSSLGSLERVAEIIRNEGIDPDDIDQFIVDGWWAEGGGDEPSVVTSAKSTTFHLPVAPYVENPQSPAVLQRHRFDDYMFNGRGIGYASYHHTTGHVLGAYCTSPFAQKGEGALVVAWDGAVSPRLYWVDPKEYSVKSLGPLMWMSGNMFADFCSHFEPFYSPTYEDVDGRHDEASLLNHLGIAGKAMAYAALGSVHHSTFSYFDAFFGSLQGVSRSDAFELGKRVVDERGGIFEGPSSRAGVFHGLTGADIVASFQHYLGRLLCDRLTDFTTRNFPEQSVNLVMAGGCALNIKWNAMLRDSGLFSSIWTPPFPNDAGAAIGAACSEMFTSRQSAALTWDVYSGPSLTPEPVPVGWAAAACDERQLARLLHEEGEPVVVLSGRAELGPRALGNRSILAPAVDPGMKTRLNEIKRRAGYRPVAPICLAEESAEVFSPGGVDPYMLFEHTVRPEWRERVPAIMHLDATARLQTVDDTSSSRVTRILREYHALSGIPLLCNTSANRNGSGFFPDVASAALWGRTAYIWSDGTLYSRSS
ncbi:hypothetical protein ADK52_22605 [Streptomyces sp. WM6372]|uniref:carbamoyltransferase N-terminal domain-containing protein n=1 Tax=Streptomyces sp. WM6372 TaxID=1415555 RepID=UPI0006ADB739|nr:carbamoyltransferase N-terminal domain-containing protein [Streptomyces sp. WM6372]KOU21882.1 hypothetical protein ADK52_22605 [Streptomyces sp. WM6372]